MTRRQFLARAAVAGAGAAATGLGAGFWLKGHQRFWDASAFPPPGRPSVAVLRATSYDAGLEQIVLDGLRAVGTDVAGKTVLLKPNLVEFDPGSAINTDPRLVAAAALAMKRLGAESVVVGEGPGHRRDTQFVVQASGMLDALAAVETPFVDLNTAPLVRQTLHSSFTSLRELWLPETVVAADVVVSMPKMKTHHWAGVTLSLKNCFGCVPGRVYGWPKNALHWAGLEQSIIDVGAAVWPHVQIVDGIVGMQGNGPIQGDPVNAGVLVFGTDPVATDTVAARLMDVDAAKVTYLQQAARFLGQGRWDLIRHTGEDPERAAVDFAVLPRFDYLKVGATSGSGGGDVGQA
jgi:uncharacterized protein (DUF362 family)